MFTQRAACLSRLVPLGAVLVFLQACSGTAQTVTANVDQTFQYEDTRELMTLVNDATELVRTKGEAALSDFRVSGSRWRQGETYIFVLDPNGKTLVHPDPSMEGKTQPDLKDINGKPIIRGLIDAAASLPDKPEGWYHYEWPVPGGLLARWKSTYVQLVTVPSGARYIVCAGVYNDRMEKVFVEDAVKAAVGLGPQVDIEGFVACATFAEAAEAFDVPNLVGGRDTVGLRFALFLPSNSETGVGEEKEVNSVELAA